MYKTGAVCAATGVSAAMLARWSDRRTLKPSRRDKASTGSGDHRLFSRDTINKIAVAKTLINLGIAASPAHAAAALLNGRFETGRTLLVVKSTGTAIVNAEFNAPLSDICGRPFQSAVIVDIGQIVAAVDQALISTQKDIR
jgi:DNA-binding transcriptional MerR regulator